MRALILSIVLLVGCQKPNEISTDSQIVLESITNSIGMKLVLIPAGTFTTGNSIGQREIRISESHYLGMFEVTQYEYEKVMGNNPSNFKGAKNPVDTVSWDDAVSFCKKLSELSDEKAAGREYRFPTEAEWEYACRATSTTRYCFGDTEESLGDYAWFDQNAGRKTHPVGEKKPNRWGLYDMHGNVWEWCQDDPRGSSVGSNRVHRGGCWNDDAGICRSADRVWSSPSFRAGNIGFRVALSPSVSSLKADIEKK